MDVKQTDEIIDVEKEPFVNRPDDIVCIFPEDQANSVTVRLNDYASLEVICI